MTSTAKTITAPARSAIMCWSWNCCARTGGGCCCGPDQNADYFAATIGGLGLTGLVVWARLQLKPVANAFMITQSQRFASLDQFWALNAEAERDWPYTVSWIDCTSKAGRGILLSGAHAPAQAALPAGASAE